MPAQEHATLWPTQLYRHPILNKIWTWTFYLSLIVLIGCVLTFSFRFPKPQGDTISLVGQIDRINRCWHEGKWPGCEYMEKCHFPLFQYIPAFIFKKLGFSDELILRLFSGLSGIAWISILAMSFSFFTFHKKKPILGLVSVFAFLSSTLFWYAHVSYGELTASALTLAFSISCLLRLPFWAIASLGWAAGITKEISAPFLLGIGFLCLFPDILRNFKAVASQTKGILLGTVLAIGSNVGFNLFRFGEPYNVFLLQPHFQVASFKQQALYFAALWLSPSGGLVFYWPVATFAVFWPCLTTIANFLRRRTDWTRMIPATLISGMLVALTTGFSKWFMPFGWIAWGARFYVAWIPTLFFLSLFHFSDEVLRFLRRLSHSRIASIIVSASITLLALPQFMVFWGDDVYKTFWGPSEACPRTAYISEPEFFYKCVNAAQWPKSRFLLLQMSSVVFRPGMAWFGLLLFFVLLSFSFLIVATTNADQNEISPSDKPSNLD